MRISIRSLALPLVFALTACAPPTPPPMPTATTEPTTVVVAPTATGLTPAPTATPVPLAPSATLVPSATAAPVGPTAVPTLDLPAPTATPALPSALIKPDTAGALAELRSVGFGSPISSVLAPGGDALVVGTTAGIVWLRLPDLTPVRFEPIGFAAELAFAPDGTQFAHTSLSASADVRTALRRATDATLIAEVDGGAPRFSPDGATLATGSGFGAEDGRSWLWRSADGILLAELSGGEPRFSPDGRYLASVELRYDGPSRTRIYTLADARLIFEAEATTPAFSPDGSLLAVSRGGQVEVYELPEGTLRTAVLTRVEPAAAFNADGSELLIVAGADLIVWDLAANRELRRIPGVNLAEEVFYPYGPQFGPDAETVASFVPALGDCPPTGVRISATADGTVLYEDDSSYGIAFASGGLAALGTSSAARVIALPAATIEELPMPGYEAVAFSPDGALMALATLGVDEQNLLVGRIELWELVGGERSVVLETRAEDFVFSLSKLRFSPDGARLSALTRYGCAAIGFTKVISWDLANGAIVSEIDQIAPPVDPSGAPVDGLPAAIAFAPDGSVAVWTENATLTLGRPGSEPSQITTESVPTALDISPDGTAVALGEDDGQVQVFAADGSAGRPLGLLDGPVRALAFSADGARLVALADDEAVVWAWPDGAVTARFSVGENATNPILSADGLLLALLDPDGVAFYELSSGQLVGMAGGDASDLALGPGQRLLATIRDGRALLWGVPR